MALRKVIHPEGLCICKNKACTVPYGNCHCGCGGKTSVSIQSDSKRGYVKDMPQRIILGHNVLWRTEMEDAAPFKIDGVYCKLIPLTQGQYTIVDAADYDWLTKYRWHAYWSPDTKFFYANTSVKHETKTIGIRLHRMILGMQYGDSNIGDHKNKVTLDNRRDNLREATYSQNRMNTSLTASNKSGYKGVSVCEHGYQSSIKVNGKNIYLGFSTDPKKVYDLYCEASLKYHGEFARFE